MVNFRNMTKEDALGYCAENRNKYLADAYVEGDDGLRQYDCLIEIIKSGTIKPSELPDYGMDFPDKAKGE